jgi:hypothetical protein
MKFDSYRIEGNVYAKDTGKYGKSLFANKDFLKDELVFIAFGPLVQKATLYTIPISDDLKIDPTLPEGNLSQYICHSCEPNLGIIKRTCFVAFRDIKKDEEITIDYGMIGYEYTDEIDRVGRVCHCGSATCRGKWGCYKELSDELKEKYEGYISDYLLNHDHY